MYQRLMTELVENFLFFLSNICILLLDSARPPPVPLSYLNYQNNSGAIDMSKVAKLMHSIVRPEI